MKKVLLITDKFIFVGNFSPKRHLVGKFLPFSLKIDFYFKFLPNYSYIIIFCTKNFEHSKHNFDFIKRKLFEKATCPIIDLNILFKNNDFALTETSNFEISNLKLPNQKNPNLKIKNKILSKKSTIREFLKNQIKKSKKSLLNSFFIDINFSQKEFLFKVKRACDTDGIILLVGKSGSEKNYTANLIHENSKRRTAHFINQNLAELNPLLIESKLFGTTKAAYTGAVEGKGLFEEAGSGSLCLDEVHETSLDVQSKIYDILDTAKYSRMGNNTKKEFLGRLIFTTNADLKFLVQDGKFKEPLYYRIKVFVIKVPSLLEHIQDINPLALKFAKEKNKTLTCSALNLLHTHAWPGNIRELKNVVYSACDLCKSYSVDERFIKFDEF